MVKENVVWLRLVWINNDLNVVSSYDIIVIGKVGFMGFFLKIIIGIENF